MDPAFAHAGHWLVQIAYLAPLGGLAVLLVAGKVRERRERRMHQEPGGGPQSSPATPDAP